MNVFIAKMKQKPQQIHFEKSQQETEKQAKPDLGIEYKVPTGNPSMIVTPITRKDTASKNSFLLYKIHNSDNGMAFSPILKHRKRNKLIYNRIREKQFNDYTSVYGTYYF